MIPTARVVGVESFPATATCTITPGPAAFNVTGISETAARETRVRVRSAIREAKLRWPKGSISVSIEPADLPARAPAMDLPIALAILEADGQLPANTLNPWNWFLGELALTGELRPVPGVFVVAADRRATPPEAPKTVRAMYVPFENAQEALAGGAVAVYGVRTLEEIVKHLRLEELITPAERFADPHVNSRATPFDMGDVYTTDYVRRGMVIAAAGGHSLMLVGSPGCGKTMLARRLVTLMPPMTLAEVIETTRIYSASGVLNRSEGAVVTRPFRAPHHTCSDSALVGSRHGGTRPGEVSLAHNGVLLLDELPEFPRSSLEAVGQLVDDGDGIVTLTSGDHSYSIPARFTLVGAANPCPCGWKGNPKRCSCDELTIRRYWSRIAQMRQRFDIELNITGHTPSTALASAVDNRFSQVSSAALQAQIGTAMSSQRERWHRVFAGRPLNYMMGRNPALQLDHQWSFAITALNLVELFLERAFDVNDPAVMRVVRVARTIADLADSTPILTNHVQEALLYVPKEQK